MHMRQLQIMSVLLTASVALFTLLGVDRVLAEVSSERVTECEELRADPDVDDVDTSEGLADACLCMSSTIAACAVIEAGSQSSRSLLLRQIPARAPPV